MCGRFALYSDPLTLARRFGTDVPQDLRTRYNAAPKQDIPIVREENGARHAVTCYASLHLSQNLAFVSNARDQPIAGGHNN